MFKKIFSLILTSCMLTMMLTTPGLAQKNQKLVIAIQPTATPQQLASQAKELEKFLEDQLGVDVEILFPTSYAGVIEALRFGHAQAAFMGSWPATMARDHAGAQVILAEVREVIIDDETKEAPYYFSYWVVAKDSPFQSMNDLKGKRAAFPSQLSSSGFIAPLSRLADLGLLTKTGGAVDPKEFFGEVVFAGGYAQAWAALKGNQADVTVIAGDVPETLYREVLDNTRVLEKQGPIPSHAVVVSKDLDQTLREDLTSALLALNAPEHRDMMRKFVSGIFVRFEAADEKHLAPLEKMIETTGFEFTEKK